MSHGLKSYRDSNDPQNGPIEEDEDDFDDYDAAFDDRERMREHTEEWKSKQFEP